MPTPSKYIAVWVSGSNPQSSAETAIPAIEWVWITQPTSGRPLCTALWITKPAWLMP